MKCLRFSTFATAVSLAFLATAAISQAAGPNPATTPASRAEVWWQQRHESMNARVKKGDVDLIFIGDSITHGLGRRRPRRVEAALRQPQCGQPGHQRRSDLPRPVAARPRQHRRHFAEVGRGDDRHEQRRRRATGRTIVAEGVKAVVEKLRAKLPQTKVLLLAIFPAAKTTTTVSARSTRRRTKSSPTWPTTRWCSFWTSAASFSMPTDG